MIEGGFNDEGGFVYIPISSTDKMTEVFRRLVIKLFEEKKLISETFAQNLLSWKNSGFLRFCAIFFSPLLNSRYNFSYH